jgi:hypothetical protein
MGHRASIGGASAHFLLSSAQMSGRQERERSEQANKQTSKQANKQTSKQANTQTSKQANKRDESTRVALF